MLVVVGVGGGRGGVSWDGADDELQRVHGRVRYSLGDGGDLGSDDSLDGGAEELNWEHVPVRGHGVLRQELLAGVVVAARDLIVERNAGDRGEVGVVDVAKREACTTHTCVNKGGGCVNKGERNSYLRRRCLGEGSRASASSPSRLLLLDFLTCIPAVRVVDGEDVVGRAAVGQRVLVEVPAEVDLRQGKRESC